MLDHWIAKKLGLDGSLTIQALSSWQLRQLNATIAHARRNSPFFRQHLPEEELTSLEHLSALPFTTPEDLRREGTRMLCVRPDQVERIVTLSTSGSTGVPKRVFFTREDQELTIDYFHYGMATLISPGDKVLILFPGESPGSLNDLLKQGLARMGSEGQVFGYPTPDRYEALCRAILSFRPTCLVGSAASMAGAARWSLEHGLAEDISTCLNSVLAAAAYVSAENRALLESVWHCRVDEHYGSTESGLGGALACAAGVGYHPQAADLYFEVVDPDTLKPLPPGMTGELVLTTLTRRGMPFIRYRTGDFTRFLPDPCPCGSVLPRLDRVAERPDPKKFDRPEAVQF